MGLFRPMGSNDCFAYDAGARLDKSANNKQAAEIAALTKKLNNAYPSHFQMKKKQISGNIA